MADTVAGYFPGALRQQFGDLIGGHRLYVPILATEVAGEIVSRLGIVWAHETAAELGCGLGDVAAAYWAARQVAGAAPVWAALDEGWSSIGADAEIRVRRTVADSVAGLARAYLRRSRPVRAGAAIAEDLALASELAAGAADGRPTAHPTGAPARGTDAVASESELMAGAGVVATRAAVGEVGPVVRQSGRRAADAALALQLVDAAAGLAVMEAALRRDPPADRWRTWLGRALLDDLGAWRTAAAARALAQGAGDVPSAVGAWAAAARPALDSTLRVVGALGPGEDPLTVVAVALRRLPAVGGP
jgi:glutamate dehydrogenase